MAVYTYIALVESQDVSGTIAADTPRQARELLRNQGLVVRDLVDYRPTTPGRSLSGIWKSFRASAARTQTTTFIRELATLLGVGVPLLEALETLARQQRANFKSAVMLLRDAVAGGSSLAAAMRSQPGIFDELSINITEVGEDSGSLDASLERLAEFRERSDRFKNRLATALIYPGIVSLVGVCSSVFLMTFVVPKILQPLIEQDLPLPLPTRIVKAASDFLVGWWWVLGLALLGLILFLAAMLRSQSGLRAWHRLLLRIPILGDLALKQAIARVAVVISTLLKSGVVLVQSLQIAQRTSGNLVLRDALSRCESAINAGGDISQAMENTGVFPPMVVQLFSLGQQSGRLEEMLDRLSAAYESQVSSDSDRLAAVFEPAMIVLLAIMVLFIVLATVLPILEVGNAIQ